MIRRESPPTDHGPRTTDCGPPPAPITPAELARVRRHYRDLPSNWRLVRNGLGNIGSGCLLEVGPQLYFLKHFDSSTRSGEWISEEHRLVRYLVNRGFPTPNVVDTSGGGTIAWLDGEPYALYEAARGMDYYADESVFAPFFSTAHAASAGRTLGQFHRALEAFPGARKKPFYGLTAQYNLLAAAAIPEGLQSLLAGWPALSAFVLAQPQLPALLKQLESHRLRLADSLPGLPRTVIHGDFIKRNLFFEGDRVTGVIDLDLCNLAPRLYDLCLALQPIAFPWDRLLRGAGEVNERDARAFLQGYLTEQALCPNETAALPAVLATCRFEFYLSLTGLDLERGDTERARRWFQLQAGVLNWFDDHPRASRFLAGEL